MSTTWFGGGVEKHFLGEKITEGSPLSGDAALASVRICLTHEEGSSLSDDAALALVRICLTPRSRRGNNKDNVEAGKVATLGE